MKSISKSNEYKIFKVKLNELIASLQSLCQSEWEEAINLIYYDVGYTVKASISTNSLNQYSSCTKDPYTLPLILKSQTIVKPEETALCNEPVTSVDQLNNIRLNCKRTEIIDKYSINTVLDKEQLSHTRSNPNLDLSYKSNFVDVLKPPTNDSSEPITYNILNLCSRNKLYNEKNTNTPDESLFNTFSKKKSDEVNSILQSDRYKGKIQFPQLQNCNEKGSNEHLTNFDYYSTGTSEHSKPYLCNDESMGTDFNDPINSTQNRMDNADIKSKSTEISLWKFQPEIYSEFQANLVDNLDIFNINFNKQQDAHDKTSLLPLKELAKCNNNELENDTFVYEFSNNFAEMSKGNNYSISQSVTALNLVNRKETNNQLDDMKQSVQLSKEVCNTEMSGSPLSCLNCKSEIADSSLFHKHQLNCLTSKFLCINCHIRFNNRMTFLKHLSSHDRNKCKKCDATFCRYSNVRQHMEQSHSIVLTRKTYTCQYCTRTFFKQVSLFHHYKVHAEENQIVCEKCGVFCRDEDYNGHMSHHIKTGLQCVKCNEIFLRKQQYQKHLQTHENYKCEYCTKSFSCKRKLYKHSKTEHRLRPKGVKLDKQYSCDQCKKIFNRPSYLNLHKKTHSGIKPVECVLCSKRFNEKRSLRKHYESYLHQYNVFMNDKPTLTEGDITFPCEYCQLILPSERMLKFHCDFVHKPKLPKICGKCDFKSNCHEEYKKHTKTHNKKLFMCAICGKGFPTFGVLKDHHIYLHTTERNFTCTACSKSFKKKSLLSRHMNTHIPEKQHKCKCGAAFKQMSNLTRHMASIHSQEGRPKKHKNASSKREVKRNDKDIFENAVGYASNSMEATNELVLGDGNIASESQFTVFDSQLIQLVPSNIQFGENLQSVSIINSDLTSFTIPTAYTINSEETIVDTNIEGELIDSSYTQFTAMTTNSKSIKKKRFNLEIDGISVPELGYDITESESVSMQTTDTIPPSEKQNVSQDNQLLQNIIF